MQTNLNKSTVKKAALAAVIALSVGTSMFSSAQRPPAPQGIEPETLRMIPDNENMASIMIVCTKPGIIPFVAVEGATSLPNFIFLTDVQMKFNDRNWESALSVSDYPDLFKTKTTKRVVLGGGLILVDRIAKAKTVKIRWASKEKGGETVLTTYDTSIAKSNPELKQFLVKKCGVLGL